MLLLLLSLPAAHTIPPCSCYSFCSPSDLSTSTQVSEDLSSASFSYTATVVVEKEEEPGLQCTVELWDGDKMLLLSCSYFSPPAPDGGLSLLLLRSADCRAAFPLVALPHG